MNVGIGGSTIPVEIQGALDIGRRYLSDEQLILIVFVRP